MNIFKSLCEHFKKLLQKRLLDFGEDTIQRKVKLLKVRRLNETCNGDLYNRSIGYNMHNHYVIFSYIDRKSMPGLMKSVLLVISIMFTD